ncbi:MAG TPA: hypothetical protein ENK73_09260 [Thiomicrospira sp.]|nr:hypothetical protein [Thiomicrospira sp.]
MKKSIKLYLLFSLMALSLIQTTFAEETHWLIDEKDNCKLITPKKVMNDGQGETKVWLEIKKDSLLIKTKSDIDAEYKDIGIKVDEENVIPFDSVENTTNALFTQSLSRVIEQFIAGQTANVHLRFWPTWPTTGIKSQSFSLIGFTRAYNSLADRCKLNKNTTERTDNEIERPDEASTQQENNNKDTETPKESSPKEQAEKTNNSTKE